MQMLKYCIIVCLFTLLIPCTSSAQNKSERPEAVAITVEKWNKYKRSESDLEKLRSTYQVVEVKVLPPLIVMYISDQELINFLKGKYLICCDALREIYTNGVTLDAVEFNIKKQVFEHHLKKAEEIELRRVKAVIPSYPDEATATDEEIIAYNKAAENNSVFKKQVRQKLDNIKEELGEPWYTMAIRRINHIASKSN